MNNMESVLKKAAADYMEKKTGAFSYLREPVIHETAPGGPGSLMDEESWQKLTDRRTLEGMRLEDLLMLAAEGLLRKNSTA